MRSLFIFLFFVLTTSCFAQGVIVRELKQTNPITKEKYLFPKVIVPDAPKLSKKINDELRSEILSTPAGTPESKIFQQVWRTAQQSPTIHGLGYRIFRNDNSVLSIIIEAEGCGAYCEEFVRYFNFDPRIGERLTLNSLLTKKGLKILVDSLNLFRQKKIRAKIIEVEHILQAKAEIDSTTRENYTEMLTLYSGCLASDISTEYVNELEFLPGTNSLKIFSDRCSAHYNRAADELWVFAYVLNFKSWQKYLTPYCKTLAGI